MPFGHIWLTRFSTFEMNDIALTEQWWARELRSTVVSAKAFGSISPQLESRRIHSFLLSSVSGVDLFLKVELDLMLVNISKENTTQVSTVA